MSKNSDKSGFLIGMALFLGSYALIATLEGYVLTKLWAWFFIPLGVPTINVAQAIGIALTINLLTHQHSDSDEDEGFEKAFKLILMSLFSSLAAWGIGAIAHSYM
jgi:hypothetical protein